MTSIAFGSIAPRTPLSRPSVSHVSMSRVSLAHASTARSRAPRMRLTSRGRVVFGTLAVVGVTLALFASGKVRVSKRANKIFLIAMFGYLAFGLINVILMWTGVIPGTFGLYSQTIAGIPIGLIIGLLVVIMAAYSLVQDFDQIQQGVRNGAPREFGWVGGFGIMVTVVWLYVEILRMIAILRGND